MLLTNLKYKLWKKIYTKLKETTPFIFSEYKDKAVFKLFSIKNEL